MPIDYSLYPPYWKQFSKHIREERAGNRCEWPDCGAVNGEVGRVGHDGVWRSESEIHSLNSDVGFALYDDLNVSRVVLTVAHLDHEGGVCECKARTGRKCARPDHVLALCQKHHLALDLPKHIAKRQRTLAAQKDAGRGLFQTPEVAA